MASSFVKEHFLFKDDSKISKEYKKALDFLCSYTMKGKNAHDDVPDALSMAVDFIENSLITNIVEIRQRFF